MPVPAYDKFINPLLRFLASKPDGAVTAEVYLAMSERFTLSDADNKAERSLSGTQLIYFQNRI
jgi:restriction system protein